MKKQITFNQLKELVKEARKSSSRDFVIKNGYLKSYSGNGGDVVIPDGVKIIDCYSFGHRDVKSVMIPDTVEEISTESFVYSTIESVTIGNGVEYIEYGAFSECKELRSITFGKGLKTIGEAAFRDCTSLTSIVIPDSVESIEDNAFYGCTNLSKVVLPKNVKLGKDCFKGTAWQKAKDAELRVKLGVELDRCKEMSRDEILEWIKQGGLCVFRRGLSFRGAKQHPMSTEEALKEFPYYSFNNPTAELIWTIYNDGETSHVALEFCELDENDMFESRKITLTVGQIKRLIKESDEVKLQMIALKKAYDQIKAGKRKAEAGNWKIEALGRWNDDLGLLEHGAHWVYFKDAAILEVNYETREYAYLMETAVLSKEMVDAMLDVLECKDFDLDGDEPDFLDEK